MVYPSLEKTISHPEYKQARNFTIDQCAILAKIAKLKISFDGVKCPGEHLIHSLHLYGYSLHQYRQLLLEAHNFRQIYYKPHSKVAILISNDNYRQLSKLVTPPKDCALLSETLKGLGFAVIILSNMAADMLKEVLCKIFTGIPKNSYCFIFYAGHGFEICNNKFILCIDSPKHNIEIQHCVSESFILNQVSKCDLALCVFIMDMCRSSLCKSLNPGIYQSIASIEDYTINGNLIIIYTTAPNQTSYELGIYLDSKNQNNETIHTGTSIGELRSDNIDRITPILSQYVKALCDNLKKDINVSSLLDEVHANVERMSIKSQTPMKVQCGTASRALYDPTEGDDSIVSNALKEIAQNYSDHCSVHSV